MRETKRAGILRAALLVAVFVFAQAAALAHLGIDDAHPIDESCAYCVSLSIYTAGNVSPPFVFDVQIASSQRFVFQSALPQSTRLRHRLARGPPNAS